MAAPLRLCHRGGEPPHAVSRTRGKRGLGLLKKRISFFARKHDPLREPGSPIASPSTRHLKNTETPSPTGNSIVALFGAATSRMTQYKGSCPGSRVVP